MTAITATSSTVVEAPRDLVWNALTDPKTIPKYFMGTTIETDWKVGSPVRFTGEWNGKAFEDKGEILTFDPYREVSFSHWSPMSGTADQLDNYHVVRITLRDVDGGTEVYLDQSNLNGQVTESDRASREDFEKNWSGVLAGLKELVES